MSGGIPHLSDRPRITLNSSALLKGRWFKITTSVLLDDDRWAVGPIQIMGMVALV
jgi:hypothetical protein